MAFSDYQEKTSIADNDLFMLEDSDNNCVKARTIKSYAGEWTYETLPTGIVMGRCGKLRRLYIDSYTSTLASADTFCTLSSGDCPRNGVWGVVTVLSVGLAPVLIKATGQGSLYTPTLNTYQSGTCFGTISYEVA